MKKVFAAILIIGVIIGLFFLFNLFSPSSAIKQQLATATWICSDGELGSSHGAYANYLSFSTKGDFVLNLRATYIYDFSFGNAITYSNTAFGTYKVKHEGYYYKIYLSASKDSYDLDYSMSQLEISLDANNNVEYLKSGRYIFYPYQ